MYVTNLDCFMTCLGKIYTIIRYSDEKIHLANGVS